MNAGFPWHEPEVIRMYTAAEEWWRMLEPVLARAFQHVGQVSYARAVALAQRVRGTYLDASAWIVFDDTAPALIQLSARAWRHVVLSNHVPELPQLAGALGLAHHFESIHTSGVTGVEKPNTEAYRRVRATLPVTATVWMIGDSVHADVLGAESVGIPAILVRNTSAHVARSCVDLMGVLDIVEAGVP
jgi:putative hydrolase of the HAD superfamily